MGNDINIAYVKKMWREGYPIECVKMNEVLHPVPPGTQGIVKHVDDAGQIHVNWETGSSLALLPGVDTYKLGTQTFERRQKNDATRDPIFAIQIRRVEVFQKAFDDDEIYLKHDHFEGSGIFIENAAEIREQLEEITDEEEISEFLDNLEAMSDDDLISHEIAIEYWDVDGIYGTREEAYQEGIRRHYHYGEYQKSWRTYSYCARDRLAEALKQIII